MDISAKARGERSVSQLSPHTDKVSLLPISSTSPRPQAKGKFIFVGEQKLWIKGVSYGTFLSHSGAEGFPAPQVVDGDFSAMARCGINTVRLYTVPPRWLLDKAQSHNLRVMIGLPWEQHVAFLDDRKGIRSIQRRVVSGVRACAGHPAVLCYALGNEIPASIVRWHGARRIEAFIKHLYDLVKKEDSSALYTYVNYPSTEYLRLPFLDFVSFNVYLESTQRLKAYLARLQNLSDERPLLLAEIGLDSQRHGETLQARKLASQIETAYAAGCAGVFVFAWTDEWYRGGYPIENWKFGITDRDRSPKPAYSTVRKAYSSVPFSCAQPWPRASVVVCSYNGARTIRDTLEGLVRLEYPRYEIIVVDDGSTDATAAIVSEYDMRLIRTKNRGLSAARNTGWQAASGDIVAYIDDDAYPDPHWLIYLVALLSDSNYVGVGGPNLAPPGDGFIADCVANAPGGPVHVLVSDREAEHIPGCNMAFKRAALEEVGGFDPRYRSAGDDVDLCWRLQQVGGTLGFHAGAVVWHHRRDSVAMYWHQQLGYGRAEALLEEKWPERYNSLGHLSWSGRLYGQGLTMPLRFTRGRLYQGVWGSAPFQPLYEPGKTMLSSIPLMPEWYLIVILLILLSLSGFLWKPLFYVLPILGIAIVLPLIQAVFSAAKARVPVYRDSFRERIRLRCTTAFLHLLQPFARLLGRVHHGLTPWRRRGSGRLAVPGWRSWSVWSEHWHCAEKRLCELEAVVLDRGAVVTRGGAYERVDLEIRGGVLGRVRVLLAVEEHGAGRQLIRVRQWPACSRIGGVALSILGALAVGTYLDRAGLACMMFVILALSLFARMALDCAFAAGVFADALKRVESKWIGDV